MSPNTAHVHVNARKTKGNKAKPKEKEAQNLVAPHHAGVLFFLSISVCHPPEPAPPTPATPPFGVHVRANWDTPLALCYGGVSIGVGLLRALRAGPRRRARRSQCTGIIDTGAGNSKNTSPWRACPRPRGVSFPGAAWPFQNTSCSCSALPVWGRRRACPPLAQLED